MNIELDPGEARVIGCLLEKEVTTPDQYPLSLNALRNAVNQKSNREPVMDLDEVQVQQVVDGLLRKHLVSDRAGYGSGRVTKYKHRFCNTEFGAFKLDGQELAVVCALLLRGPQTPGELRTRTNRLCEFRDVGEVEALLDAMALREDGPLVVKLAREPGKRESRYAHLFSGEVEAAPAGLEPEPVRAVAGDDRLSALEREVADLRQAVDQLRATLSGQD